MDKKKVRNKEKERSHRGVSKSSRDVSESTSKQSEPKKSASEKSVNSENNKNHATPESFHHQFLNSLCVEDRSGVSNRLSPDTIVHRPPQPQLEVEPFAFVANKQTQTKILCDEKGVQVQLRDYEMELALALTAGLGARLDQNNNTHCCCHTASVPLPIKPKPQAYTQTNQLKTYNTETQTLPPVSNEKSTQTFKEFIRMNELQTTMNNLLTMIIDKTQNGNTNQQGNPDSTDLAVSYSDLNKLIMKISMELNKPTPPPKNNNVKASDELKEIVNWIDSAPSRIPNELKQSLRSSVMLKLQKAEARENSYVPDVASDDDNVTPPAASTSSAAVPTFHVPARLPPLRPPASASVAPAPSKMAPHNATKNSREQLMNSSRIGHLLTLPMPPIPAMPPMPPPPCPAVITAPPARVSQVRNSEEAPRTAPMKQTKKDIVTAEDIAQFKRAKRNNNNAVQNGHTYQSGNPRNIWVQGQHVNANMRQPPSQQQQVRQAANDYRYQPYYTNATQMQMEQMEQAQPPQQMRYAQPQDPSRSATPFLRTYQRQRQRPPNIYADCSMPAPGPGNNEVIEQMPDYSSSYPNPQWGLYYPQ